MLTASIRAQVVIIKITANQQMILSERDCSDVCAVSIKTTICECVADDEKKTESSQRRLSLSLCVSQI